MINTENTAEAVKSYLNPAQDDPARAAQSSMIVAVGAKPDYEAELRRAAQRTGVPLETARNYPDEIKQQAALSEYDFEDMARSFPNTTKFLSDPDNTRMVHDDIGNLSATESIIGPIRGPRPTFLSYATGVMKSLGTGAELARQGVRMQLADLLGQDAVRADAERKYSQASLEQAVSDPAFQSSTASGIYSGVTSTVRAIPGLIASVATRSPTPGLAAIGIQTEADAYGKYRGRGATPGEALTGAVVEGGTEVATELLPMSFLVRNLGKAGAGQFLTGLLAREIPGEQLATVVQDAVDTAIANPDKTWGDYLAERPDAAYQTLIATVTMGAVMQGGNAALRRIAGRNDEAQHVQQFAEALTEMNTLAEASKLRERDATTAAAFFQSLLEDGRDSVWITPQALSESGMLDQIAAAVPGVAEQLRGAAETSREIELPIAPLMATLASPELAQAILPHVSDEPGGFTQTTAQEYLQSGNAQELQAEVERMVAQQQGDEAFSASRSVVADNLFGQLQQTGRFSDDVSRAYADLVGNFFAVQAARTGETPEALYERYPLRVTAEQIGGEQLEQTNQTIEVDGQRRPVTDSRGRPVAQDMNQQLNFYRWFGDSKVVDDTGHPLVVYHGTNKTQDGDAFTMFDTYASNYGLMGMGGYFTADAEVASSYTTKGKGDSPSVYPAYLSIQNPLDMDAKADPEAWQKQFDGIEEYHEGGDTNESWYRAAEDMLADKGLPKWEGAEAMQDGLRGMGHDGITHVGGGRVAADGVRHRVYIAFDPEQIKSATGNTGDFDPNNPSILAQGQRGSFSPSTTTISLLQGADLSTFSHESGHFFLEVMNDIASRPDAPADISEDFQKLLAWWGVPDLETWNGYTIDQKREHHEQFARSFEAYLFEGKAPVPGLQSLFSRFRSWLVNVYQSLTRLNANLTDEVRSVFDRMLASAEAIQQAEHDGGMDGLFATKPEFMADEEFQAYRALSNDATQDAMADLERRSLRDMKWLSNAKARVLKQIQRDTADKRAAVRSEVEQEVAALPVNRARDFLRKGKNPDGTTSEVHKLSEASLIELYGGDGNKYALLDWKPLTGRSGMVAKDGITPDMAAELFGYANGDSLVRDLLQAEKAEDTIRRLTDQRVLERYGDLADEDAINRAVEEALHNEARMRFVATELNALNKAVGKKRVLSSAAKSYAEAAVARTVVSRLRPDLYTAAARRASLASEKAFKAGDLETAAVEKQNQLINTYAAKAAITARDDVERAIARFNRMARGNVDDLSKTRDIDMVMATRAILAEFGIERSPKAASDYLRSVESYDPGMAQVLRDRIDAATQNAAPLPMLTVEQVRGLRDEVESLWYLARRSRQMEVDGDLIDRQEIQEKLAARLEEIGVPEIVPGEGRAITPGEVALSKLQTLRASMRRVEAWADAKDGSPMGPFRSYVWNIIKDPADAYRAEKAQRLRQYRDLLKTIAPTLTQTKISAPELNYTFGYDDGGMGKVELLHAILHTGNAGNKKKLLLGRNWARENEDGSLDTSRWDSFVQRMIAEGKLTKADFDFAQGVWDLLEELKPAAQKMHRQVFGLYFDEVTADPFKLVFGSNGGETVSYRGGYVPAIADARIVSDAKTRALIEEETGSMMNVLPSTSKGFTKSRVEYNRPLLLDLRLLSSHIDKVLLFSHLEGPVRDVRRVLASNEVAKPLNRIDPAAYDGLITPWLNRTARQQVETPVSGSNGLMRFFSVVRQRAGMAAMFANVSNAAQQLTGFSLAAVKVKPRYLLSASVDFLRSPGQVAETVASISPYMANRMENEVSAMNEAIADILLNPNVYQKAVNWTARHTYFLQSAIDNVMGPIIWQGAYNQAMETAPAGLSDDQLKAYARRLADSAVRETQGSTLPEDVSRIETGTAFVRLFTQFAGYFNMQANLLGTEFAKIAQDTGLRRGAGRGFYVLLFGFLVPAWAATAIALAFRGGPEDDDKDGEYLDDWLAQTFGWGTLRSATAMVPVAGQAANALANTFNSKPYDDRISTSPAISMIESAVSVPSDVYKLAAGGGSETKTIRDVATLISMTVGVPANAIAKPVVYLHDVNAGNTNPTSGADAARGAVTGVSSPESKR